MPQILVKNNSRVSLRIPVEDKGFSCVQSPCNRLLHRITNSSGVNKTEIHPKFK